MHTDPPLKVPVGATSVAGYSATVIGVIAMILVVVFDVDQEQATLVAAAILTGLSFALTQIGRYVQSRELARKPGVIAVAPPPPVAALAAAAPEIETEQVIAEALAEQGLANGPRGE